MTHTKMGCCAKFSLFIISFIAIGIITAIGALSIFFITKYKIQDISEDNTLLVFSIIILCASAFILVFAIYASCTDARCPSFILGVILFVYGGAMVAAIVLYAMFNKKIWSKLADKWDDLNVRLSNSSVAAAIHEVEEKLNCRGWHTNYSLTLPKCADKVETPIKKYLYFIYAGVALTALLLFLAAGIAFWKTCKSSDDTKKNQPIEQPLSYGW